MKHIPLCLVLAILLLGIFTGFATAGFFDKLFGNPVPQPITLGAATSTNVQNLRITALGDGGLPCLIIANTNGLVATTTCATGGGGSGAPASSTFVVLSLRSDLSAERVATSTGAILITDGGANGNLTWSFVTTTIGTAALTNDAGFLTTVDISANTNLTAGDALTLTNDDIDFDGGASPSGDLGGTWASPSVTDDSHAHTAGTISGLSVADFVSALVSQWTNDAGYGSSTGANPTATADTTAVNGSAITFMRSDGAPKINDKFASSSITFNIYDATTTYPYRFSKWRTETLRTITEISCSEVAGTSTLEIYRVTTLTATSTGASQILGSIACGLTGTTSNSFVTSTLTAGSVLMVNVTSSNAGTPTWTALNIYFKK